MGLVVDGEAGGGSGEEDGERWGGWNEHGTVGGDGGEGFGDGLGRRWRDAEGEDFGHAGAGNACQRV